MHRGSPTSFICLKFWWLVNDGSSFLGGDIIREFLFIYLFISRIVIGGGLLSVAFLVS